MLGIKRIVLGMLIGGGTVYFADHYHLVQTNEGLVVVPRAYQVPLRSSYADVRGWDSVKWSQYPELSESLEKDGRGGLLISGAVDSLLQRATQMLNSAPSATATGVAPADRPPIVFESPVAYPSGLTNSATQISNPANSSATDDSLLGRLSRQLQSGTTPPAQSAPPARTRDVPPTTSSIPQTQSNVVTPADGRAGISQDLLPENLYPSIHSAAMQRVTTEVARPVEAVQQQIGQQATQLRERVQSSGVISPTAQNLMQGVASNVLNGTNVLPQNGTGSQGIPRESSSAAGGLPVEIQPDLLRERFPSSIQDTMRLFTPQDPFASPQAFGNAIRSY